MCFLFKSAVLAAVLASFSPVPVSAALLNNGDKTKDTYWNEIISDLTLDDLINRRLARDSHCKGGALQVEDEGLNKVECLTRGEALCKDGYKFGIAFYKDDYYLQAWHTEPFEQIIYSNFKGASKICIGERSIANKENNAFLYVVYEPGVAYLICPNVGSPNKLPRLKIRPRPDGEAQKNKKKKRVSDFFETIVKFRDGAMEDDTLWEIIRPDGKNITNPGCSWQFVPFPTAAPTSAPTISNQPSASPTVSMSPTVSSSPTTSTPAPTLPPTLAPTPPPTPKPSNAPTASPSSNPSSSPTSSTSPPSPAPTTPKPSASPSTPPTGTPTASPSSTPSSSPSASPTSTPSSSKSQSPSDTPSSTPSGAPSDPPSLSSIPSTAPSSSPSVSSNPSWAPTSPPSVSLIPSTSPSSSPSESSKPSSDPSSSPSNVPSFSPSEGPSAIPSASPSDSPSAEPTAKPTRPVMSLETTFAGGNANNGNIFTIRARNDIRISRLDIHTQNAGTHPIKVWTKSGDYEGFENTLVGWDLILDDEEVTTEGHGIPTPLGRFNDAVVVKKGYNQSFRVISPDKVNPIRYTNGPRNGEGEGSIAASNEDLEILLGRGCGPTACTDKNREWNGVMYYMDL